LNLQNAPGIIQGLYNRFSNKYGIIILMKKEQGLELKRRNDLPYTEA
jgi:hypothetical protein